MIYDKKKKKIAKLKIKKKKYERCLYTSNSYLKNRNMYIDCSVLLCYA